ncbi:MAG TPA: N-acetylmuramoyl-L-alanine amidase, partial [Chitinophagales bacterium]|nr:N-acetylmuramoyl-L-alanine amidase [Chitinophagales bacterium]
MIDAGHGGKDPGAIGPDKINEKDVALAVALKLGDYIEKNFPDIKVIYTRKKDEFVELYERADIANKAKADLFICIHCNSNTNPSAYGTSTYVLGLHRTEANLEVAKRENSVILLEDDRDKNYEIDPNSPEGNIIMSMKQNAYLDQSIDIASKIENEFETNARRKSLGVKQAGFYVLYRTTMPSLLSEIGFISNPDEEKFLNSAKGQDIMATSLFKAFKAYKFEMENKSEGTEPTENNTVKQEPTPTSTPAPTPSST